MAKQEKYKIIIPKPCHENWDIMTPVERGRFCAACQKTIIDFTGLGDKEVMDIFTKAGKDIPCGRFLNTQLNREFVSTPNTRDFASRSLLQKIAASYLLFQSLVQNVAAQTKNTKHASAIEAKFKTPIPSTDSFIILKGKAIDYTTRRPLDSVSVWVSNFNLTAITDTQGRFLLKIPRHQTPVTLMLNASEKSGFYQAHGLDYIFLHDSVYLNNCDIEKDIILSAYRQEKLPQVIIKDFKIQRTEHIYGGAPVQIFTPPKPTAWQKMKSIFTRRKKAHYE